MYWAECAFYYKPCVKFTKPPLQLPEWPRPWIMFNVTGTLLMVLRHDLLGCQISDISVKRLPHSKPHPSLVRTADRLTRRWLLLVSGGSGLRIFWLERWQKKCNHQLLPSEIIQTNSYPQVFSRVSEATLWPHSWRHTGLLVGSCPFLHV